MQLRFFLLSVMFSSALACASSHQSPVRSVTADLVIADVNVISMVGDSAVQAGSTVVVRGDRIVWVGASTDAPALKGDPVRIDGSGQFLIPGLSDMHAHLPDPSHDSEGAFDTATYLQLYLEAGVTSLRSMRGHASHRALREAIRSGELAGPDLYLGSEAVAVDTLSLAQARAIAAKAVTQGASFIKLLRIGDETSFLNLSQAAREVSLGVAGHRPASASPDLLIEHGYRSLEHLHGMMTKDEQPPAKLAAMATQLSSPTLFHCPTLHWYALRLGVYAPEAFSSSPAMTRVSADMRATWTKALHKTREGAAVDGPRDTTPIARRLEVLKVLADAGAKLVIGPDPAGAFGLPGYSVHEEMRLFADAGLKPMAILRAATLYPAQLRNADDEGTIRVGNVANLVVLAKNPLESVDHISSVVATVHRGRWARHVR